MASFSAPSCSALCPAQNSSAPIPRARDFPIPETKPAEPNQPYSYLSWETSEGYGEDERFFGWIGQSYGRLTAIARANVPDTIEDYLPETTQWRPKGGKPWPRWTDRDLEMHNFIDQKLFGGWHPLALVAVAQYHLFQFDIGHENWRDAVTAADVAVLRRLDYMYQKGAFDFLQPLSILKRLERTSVQYGLFRASLRHRFMPKNSDAKPPSRLVGLASFFEYYESQMGDVHPGVPYAAKEIEAESYIKKAIAGLLRQHPLHFAHEDSRPSKHRDLTFKNIRTNNPPPRGPRSTRRGSTASSEDINIRSIPRVVEGAKRAHAKEPAAPTINIPHAGSVLLREAQASPVEHWEWIQRVERDVLTDVEVQCASSRTLSRTTLNSGRDTDPSPATGPTNITNPSSTSPPDQSHARCPSAISVRYLRDTAPGLPRQIESSFDDRRVRLPLWRDNLRVFFDGSIPNVIIPPLTKASSVSFVPSRIERNCSLDSIGGPIYYSTRPKPVPIGPPLKTTI